MDYLPYLLKRYDQNLQPTNSERIKIAAARDQLYPGAHLATSKSYEHYHHGIVIDTNPKDLSIIHLWGADKEHSRIQTTNLPIFLAGGIDNLGKNTRDLYLIHYDDDTTEKRYATVEMAKTMLEKNNEVIYNLATCNCESFARFCRTNQWTSEQVIKVRDLLITYAKEIYEEIKGADENNRNNVRDLLKIVPIDALTPSEKALYNEYCGDITIID